jgi:hypothetical protein
MEKDWLSKESEFSFVKVHAVIDFININFRGGSLSNVGIIYISVGGQAGKITERYLLFIPYYNPTVHGYNFHINHPYVFVRGFSGVASSEFYEWLDNLWLTAIKTTAIETTDSPLHLCSPVMVAELGENESGTFSLLDWSVSLRDVDTLTVAKSLFECWIHGPRDSNSMEKSLLKSIKLSEAPVEFHEYLVRCCNDESGALEEFVTFFQKLMTSSNSYSFPTIQVQITSPLEGLVPFSVRPVRFQIGGVVDQADRISNEVHIPVATPDYIARAICFRRLWDILHGSNHFDSSKAGKIRAVRKKLLEEL